MVGPSVSVVIPAGSTAQEAAQAWVEGGIRTSPWLLGQWFRWMGDARKIRAGTYAADLGVTPEGIFEKMLKGQEALASVRFLEGWTFKQLRAELAHADKLQKTTASWTAAAIMEAIGAPKDQWPEGRFFPDTYVYPQGASDLHVLKAAYRAMQSQMQAIWETHTPDSPLKTPDEMLILASIIEKETGHEKDRSLVAGVFNNRLRLGMPLQTDPTIIYGLGDKFDGNLRRRDLQTDQPYNTYLRAGLPPTPIAMPSRAALIAAVQPAPTKAIFFVSRGDGTSEFSETLVEHNRAVNKYQRGRP
jgi:UPF0755 protein